MVQVNPTLSVSAFYVGRSVFVTGASGFMGKVLIEKLLRSCPDIREIFLLMRPKKGVSIDDRLAKILALPLFDKLRSERPSSFEKLIPVSGDVAEEGLGMSALEREFVTERVSVVFHVAASVRFDDSLKDAVFINTRATRDVCILAQSMKNFVALVHVSSTYSQADKPEVEEIVYPTDIDYRKTIKIVENIDEHTLKILTPKYLGTLPNTYAFTKRLAEQVVDEYSAVLPIVLFRPSIVISTIEEPIKGWIDNFNGPVGMMVGGGKGILRILYTDPKITSDYIPVDVAIKGIITAAWQRGIKTLTQDPNIHVYNCASNNIMSLSLKEMVNMGLNLVQTIPLDGSLWNPNTMTTNNKTIYYVLMLLLHLLPALLIDGILKISGRRPILVKLQRKIYTANSALEYYLTNEWTFRNEKMLKLITNLLPEEAKVFGYDYSNFGIHDYFRNCVIGCKLYLLHEDMNKLEDAKVHCDRMRWVDRIFKMWLGLLFIWAITRFNVLSRLAETL